MKRVALSALARQLTPQADEREKPVRRTSVLAVLACAVAVMVPASAAQANSAHAVVDKVKRVKAPERTISTSKETVAYLRSHA